MYSFDHRKRPLSRRTPAAYPPIAFLFAAVQLPGSRSPLHGLISHVPGGQGLAEIALIPVNCFISFTYQIYVAVMCFRCGGFEAADQVMIHVHLHMALVAVMHLIVFRGEAAIAVHMLFLFIAVLYLPSFLLCFLLPLHSFPACIRFHETSVLYNPCLDLVAFQVKLLLQLLLDQFINACLLQAILETSGFPKP